MRLSWSSCAMLFLPVSVAAWSVGCGSSDTSTGAGPADSGAVVDSRAQDPVVDAGVRGDADANADASFDADGSAACNVLPNGGAVIQPTVVAQSLPSGAGGAVAPGTYHLTAVTYYFGVDAGAAPTETWQEAISVNGVSFATVAVRNAGPEQRTSGAFVMNGSEVTFTESCPVASAHGPFEYTATGSELAVYVASAKRALVFTKQ
jgi:hypothetical protein